MPQIEYYNYTWPMGTMCKNDLKAPENSINIVSNNLFKRAYVCVCV